MAVVVCKQNCKNYTKICQAGGGASCEEANLERRIKFDRMTQMFLENVNLVKRGKLAKKITCLEENQLRTKLAFQRIQFLAI